jgi:hypothetical protein
MQHASSGLYSSSLPSLRRVVTVVALVVVTRASSLTCWLAQWVATVVGWVTWRVVVRVVPVVVDVAWWLVLVASLP